MPPFASTTVRGFCGAPLVAVAGAAVTGATVLATVVVLALALE